MKPLMQGRWIMALLLLIIIIILIGILLLSTYKSQEGFMPRKIKEMYRPMERNVRQTCEGFYNRSVNGLSRFLRQLSIL